MAQGINGYFEFNTNVNWAKIRVYYNQEYDIANNESTITINSVRMWSSSDGWYGVNWWVDGIIQINNKNVIVCDSYHGDHSINVYELNTWDDGDNNKLKDVETRTPVTASTVIKHENDGTATLTVKFIGNNYSYCDFYSLNYESACFRIPNNSQKSVTLTTIPRASSISSVGSVVLGNNCNVVWTPASTSFSYKLKFSLGSWSYTTSVISPAKTSAYTYTGYKIPLDVANQLPKVTSGTMTVVLYTYSNSSCSTQIGSAATKTFTATVPTSIIPTISSCKAEIVNSNSTINRWGVAVAGYTKVKVTASASGAYGSTISNFTISGGYSTTQSGTGLSYTGGTITSSGSKTFNVLAKDSRGRSSSVANTTAIVFYAYSKPSVSSFTVTRSSSDQSKVVVKGNWSFSSINNNNSADGTLYYKKSTDTSWTYYGVISKNTSTTLTVNFDTAISYNFKLVVTDALSNSAQDEAFISTMKVLLDFKSSGKGLGIGKICESDSMEVSLDAKFFGAVYINGVTLEDYIKSVVG